MKSTQNTQKTQEKLIQLRTKDIPIYREKLTKEQNGLCAICQEALTGSGISLDHQHKTKKETNGVCGAGLIRCWRDW